MQQLRVQLRHGFAAGEQPPQPHGFVFRVPNGVVLLCRQLKEQCSGVVLVDGLPLQCGGQILPRFPAGSGHLGCRWLNTVGAAYELVEQVGDDLLNPLRRRRAAEPSQGLLRRRFLRGAGSCRPLFRCRAELLRLDECRIAFLSDIAAVL